MKKVLLILLLFLTLSACATEKAEDFEVNSFAVDMSGYRGVSSTNHNFKGISPDEIKRILDEDGSALIFMGYNTCSICQEVARYLQEAASEEDLTIYYMDCYSEKYPLAGDKFDMIIEILNPILDLNPEGEKTIYTPHLFSIVNGKLNKGYISTVPGWNYGNPSASQIDELKEIYKDIMKPFK